MNRAYCLFALIAVCVGNVPALAHKPSDSYLRISGGGELLTAEWDIGLKDLEYLLGLDADQDGNITWGELKGRSDDITAHALSRLKISVRDEECALTVEALKVVQHSDGSYACLQIAIDAPGDVEELSIEYSLLFDVDPTHRGLVLFSGGPAVSTYVLSPSEASATIAVSDASKLTTLLTYVREGVWHIWIGFDHILFLIALLLPAVLVRREDAWQPVEEFEPTLRTVSKVVTVFTLAHSITLWLAVMEYVSIPSQFIESTIAFSIVVTAFNNLYPVLRVSSWMIAFAFGLIHGFGFANVLLDLGLSSVALGFSLLGFNLGVELGQLAIVLVYLPIAWALRRTQFYEHAILKGGSILVAMISAIWMVERIGNVEILGI